MRHDLKSVVGKFDIRGDFLSAEPYGSGHINDTYAARYSQAGRTVRYIHQRINHSIFKDPESLMDNITRVTRHLRDKLIDAGAPDITRRVLGLVPTIDGQSYHRDESGNYWRTYFFVENARTYDQIETAKQAYEAARAFGRFQRDLRDLPGERLAETITGFHNTRARFDALVAAAETDSLNRARNVREEIDFALRREAMADVLLELHRDGAIPEIITHSDTKLNNVMIDDATSEGICVIDLDTVMPGLSLYDFGDMVRTAACPAPEDECDLSKVEARMDMFKTITQGYLSSAGDMLTRAEIEHLPFSARLITFEIGIRFLTDYLKGDEYFKIHREGHNIDRCRVQFKMVQSMEVSERAMNRIVEECCKKGENPL